MKLTEFLSANVDSHSLLGLNDLMNEAAQTVEDIEFSHGTPEDTWVLTDRASGKTARVTGMSAGRYEQSYGTAVAGPKGLTLAEDTDRSVVCIAGYTLGQQIARGLLGEAPGDEFYGRGSAFRANIRGLREAGY